MSTLERFRKVAPAAGTFSKDPRAFWGTDPDAKPCFLVSGNGSHVTDEDGNRYIDWICALGANILGYNFKDFNYYMNTVIDRGVSFSLPTTMEVTVAEKMCQVVGLNVPGMTPDGVQVRFTKTGSECTEAAVRLARAVTGRDWLLRCSDSYLGWGPTFIATTPPALGIPPEYAGKTVLFKYGQNLNTLFKEVEDKCFNHTSMWLIEHGNEYSPAAVILEQGLVEPPDGWYKRLRKWCDHSGALLILDETASGFRYSLGGAAAVYGIEPDLICYGKALGNGFPISVLAGRREYMEWFARQSPVFVSGTFCGEVSGLAAANYVLDTLMSSTELRYRHLHNIGKELRTGLIALFEKYPFGYKVIGHDPRFIIQWPSDQHHAYFLRGMAEQVVLCNRPFYTTLSHSMLDVKETLQVADQVLSELTEEKLAALKPYQLPFVLFRNR